MVDYICIVYLSCKKKIVSVTEICHDNRYKLFTLSMSFAQNQKSIGMGTKQTISICPTSMYVLSLVLLTATLIIRHFVFN